MRRFAGIEPSVDAVPDESTILRFRHLLERHQLTEAMFVAVRALLEERQFLLKAGTIVDATIIAAPPSTKNAAQARDPEMHQTKKDQTWHFGMKAHVGTDLQGIVHRLTTTAAHVADITQLPDLLHGRNRCCTTIRRNGASSTGPAPRPTACATASSAAARRSRPITKAVKRAMRDMDGIRTGVASIVRRAGSKGAPRSVTRSLSGRRPYPLR
jgi:IS5 family transposase